MNHTRYQQQKMIATKRATDADYSPTARGLFRVVKSDEKPPLPVTRPSGRTAPSFAPIRVNNVRQMMLDAGIGPFLAPMAQQSAFFLPRTTDPYSQGVILLVEGLQRLLNRTGACLVVDGELGPRTELAVREFSGPLWGDRTWIQLYSDVMSGQRWRGFRGRSRRQTELMRSLQDETQAEFMGLGSLGDLLASPIPWLIGGVALYLHSQKKKGSR